MSISQRDKSQRDMGRAAYNLSEIRVAVRARQAAAILRPDTVAGMAVHAISGVSHGADGDTNRTRERRNETKANARGVGNREKVSQIKSPGVARKSHESWSYRRGAGLLEQ